MRAIVDVVRDVWRETMTPVAAKTAAPARAHRTG